MKENKVMIGFVEENEFEQVNRIRKQVHALLPRIVMWSWPDLEMKS